MAMNKPRTGIFWDFESCPIPEDRVGDGSRIASNVSHVAAGYGRVTVFNSYMNEKPSTELYTRLAVCGVSMVDRHTSQETNSTPFVKLLTDLLVFAVDNQSPATIVLVSNNPHYTYPLSLLHLRGFSVVIIAPDLQQLSHSLRTQAISLHDWTSEIVEATNLNIKRSLVELNNVDAPGPDSGEHTHMVDYTTVGGDSSSGLLAWSDDVFPPLPMKRVDKKRANEDDMTMGHSKGNELTMQTATGEASITRTSERFNETSRRQHPNIAPFIGHSQPPEVASSSRRSSNSDPVNRQGANERRPSGSKPRNPSDAELRPGDPRSTFRPLIAALQVLQSEGNYQPLRSVVGARLRKDVYTQAGASSFSQYVTLAESMGVVQLGGQGGKSWISLKTGGKHTIRKAL